MGQMRQAFGSSIAVSTALNQLRAAAQAHGLVGVYIVGGFGVPDGSSGQDGSFYPNLTTAFVDGYDAVMLRLSLCPRRPTVCCHFQPLQRRGMDLESGRAEESVAVYPRCHGWLGPASLG